MIRNLITINHNLTDIGGKHELGSPKTESSHRVIVMSDILADILREQKDYIEQLSSAIGESFNNTWESASDGSANYDNTVSVVDLESFTEVRKIEVSANPGRIKALDSHRFIVACAGNYDNIPASCWVVDVNDNSKTEVSVAASNFDVCGNTVYMYATSYDATWNTTTDFYTMDINTLAPAKILANYSSELSSAYAINVNPADGKIYVSNSVYGANSDIYIFSAAGEKLGQEEAGIFTNKIIF